MDLLPYDTVRAIGEELREKLTTPHVFTALCDLHGKDYYTSSIRANTDHMATFALSIIEAMLDNGVNDNEVLEVYRLLRTYISKRGGLLRPAKQEDFNEGQGPEVV